VVPGIPLIFSNTSIGPLVCVTSMILSMFLRNIPASVIPRPRLIILLLVQLLEDGGARSAPMPAWDSMPRSTPMCPIRML
jgi:hypothetical protein